MSTTWHPIDQAAAMQLTQLTSSPGIVMQFSNALPASLQKMPGVVSHFMSSYINKATSSGVVIGGEMVVVRTDQATAKAYNFAFGTSSNGRVCFAGPFKNFPAHHSPAANPAPVSAMFGHVPLPKT